MQNIKNKIKKIEDAENLIKKLKDLVKDCEASHIDPAVCFSNCGSLSGAVVIDSDLFELTISTQIKTLEASIQDDKIFITGIEIMLSKSIQGEK